jgi:ferric-dicitrate binding protein FerR (iron transport regulator)
MSTRPTAAELVAAVADCLATTPEERPASAAALARRLAPVASEAETLTLPADPSRRATEILAPGPGRGSRRPLRRAVAAGGLALVAAAGAAAAVVLAGGGNGPAQRTNTGAGSIAQPATGASAAQEAENIVQWLRRYSR